MTFGTVEILAGLHWYLKYQCGSHISWEKTGGAQLFSVPRAGLLPRVKDAALLVQRPIPWNYYQNAKFNVSTTDLNDFFGGPAFLAWSRMGNLHGTYSNNTFDENTPPEDKPQFISSLGAAIFRGMQSGDNDAVWLMQVGVGMSMEGIEQNPVVYDLMSEMAFQHDKVDVEDKNRDIIVAFPDVDPAVISVLHESYNDYGKSESRRTALEEIMDSFDPPHLWYSTSQVIHALELFIASGDELSEVTCLFCAGYDLVDLTRQALAKYANQLFLKVIEAYHLKDVHGVASHSQNFLDLVEDTDTLLACHDGFLLGPWLESAKRLA
ncbi:Alpha-N-acetylglucosaminidase [Morella rubra]|uniref:Alpha-N-acetylglucosaminidase n=1 Tax=Morella rubra TaxID=262757 RepID=A0A6A1UIN2_9ROSI|nr:Alpha-N-acetylglucosaminidase [Morella rubra]